MLEELSGLSGQLSFSAYDDREYGIDINVLTEHDADAVTKQYLLDTRSLIPRVFLRFSSIVEYSEKELAPWREGFEDIPEKYIVRMYYDSLADSLYKRWIDLALASHIARPGSISFLEGISTSGGEYPQWRDAGINALASFIAEIRKIGWPPIHALPLTQVWNWLRGVPGFEDGVSKSPLGRAIAALSYLVNGHHVGDDDHLNLVWALLGLEALYGKGNVGLRAQILDKSEAFLGVRKSHAKEFGWMYDFRSRFIHGDLDFTYQHNVHDATPEHEKFHSELWRATTLASSVLVASLQEMCIRNLFELSFRYAVVDSISTS